MKPITVIPPSVLFLDADRAEWLRSELSGALVYGRADVLGDGSTELLQAVEKAFQQAGGRNRRCVLLLGAGLAHLKLVTLGPVPRSELATILARKAESLIGCERGEAAFNALFLQSGPTESDGREPAAAAHEKGTSTRWILTGMRRSRIQELMALLRDRGFRVVRVANARLAVLSEALDRRPERTGAQIVVIVESRAVAISLLADRVPVHQSVLDGDLETQPALAMTLIQELKGVDAYWKKQSRGASVQGVVILGTMSDRGELLRIAVQSALPGVDVDLVVGVRPGEDAGRENGREVLLAAGLRSGSLHLDFAVPLPARRMVMASTLAAFGALMLGTMGLTWKRLDSSAERLERDTGSLLDRSADLPRLLSENERAREQIDTLQKKVRRIREIEQSGWPLAPMLHDVAAAFGSDAALLSISIGRRGDNAGTTLSGVTDPEPLTAMRTIERLAQRLDSSPWFSEVTAVAPSKLPAPLPAQGGFEPLVFELRAEGVEKP